MPATPHAERHFEGGATVRDVVIGMSDGLTVPFALAAGLSGAITASSLVVTAGLAEIAAGAIAMGLGGYLAARSDAEHYASEEAREHQEVREKPHAEEVEIEKIFSEWGLTREQIAPVLDAFKTRPDAWVDFMMRLELGLSRPEPTRAVRSAGTIALSYVAGGLVPLSPYLFVHEARSAVGASVALTLAALFAFGFVKGRFTGVKPLRSAAQTVLVGALAAGAAWTLARVIS